MNRIVSLNQSRRNLLFEATAREMKVSPVVIEKDFWVCFVLNYLMNESKFKEYFIFKGGTSLSKCYGVIKRFSEDIDLVLKWDKLGFTDEEVYLKRTKNQDNKFETLMNEKGAAFIQGELKEELKKNLEAQVEGLSVESDEEDLMILYVYYPTSYRDEYIKQAVKLEIGPVSPTTPNEECFIEPYCFRVFSVEDKKSINVKTVSLARTFWEKVFILYAECNRPQEKKTPSRYSRHYYDVYMIYKSKYFKNIVSDRNLFESVKLFKSKYYRTSWSRIEDCSLKEIVIVPSEARLKDLLSDYKNMLEMIFDNPPTFEEIIKGMKDLEATLRQLG